MLKWVNVNEKYLDYLRKFEQRIPRTNYGSDKLKPFFGVLFEADDLCYITQVSHPQSRHAKMKNQKDFFKIYDPADPARLIAVVNLNYMFPIPKCELSSFDFSSIDTYRTFDSLVEKNNYISLLKKEMQAINNLNISDSAQKLYIDKYKLPEDMVSKRCLDFKNLEKHAKKWLSELIS